MQQANFGYIIRKKSYYSPDCVAIVEQATREEYTYRELERRSNSVAQALAERGIGEGDRMAELLRNSIEFFDLFSPPANSGRSSHPSIIASPQTNWIICRLTLTRIYSSMRVSSKIQ